jgi:hypothetical protein
MREAGGPGHCLHLIRNRAAAGEMSSWEQATQDLQGCVLATCALMAAVSLLPLSCPSRQLQEMYNCAVRMIEEPLSSDARGRCEERRLGSLMMSCLACNLPMAMLQVRRRCALREPSLKRDTVLVTFFGCAERTRDLFWLAQMQLTWLCVYAGSSGWRGTGV